MDYNKTYFAWYVHQVYLELQNRNIKCKEVYLDEIITFCSYRLWQDNLYYPEHNDRYLRQCYYNLEEKYDRGILTEEESTKVTDAINIDYLTMCR